MKNRIVSTVRISHHQTGALARTALRDEVAEDRQDHRAGQPHQRACDRSVLQHEGHRKHQRHTDAEHEAELVPVDRCVVGNRADVVERAAHQCVVQQSQHHARAAHRERRMPAPLRGHDRRGEHRERRADVDRHVVQRKRAVDLGVVAFIDSADEVGGVGFEQAVADHDDAERAVQQREVVRRHRQQQVAGREDRGADRHAPPGTEDLVADPPADRRRGVHQRGERAPSQVGLVVVVAELLHHEQNQQRGHAVVAEALPHLDQENRAERLGLTGPRGVPDAGRCGSPIH
jgi:hypothetical protein